MALKDKLKELRVARNMTQEAVAEQLGVSSQTVSKWERGLLSPDISLLPKIAVLYRCSIDSIFDMGVVWGIEHRKEFEANIRNLYAQNDHEGVYMAWIREIELNPDHYPNYPDVMLHVLRKKMFKDDYVRQMLSLAERAEKYCMDDDIRNEIYRIMLQICSQCENPKIKEKANTYYEKLPMLRHSREVYAKFVMDGDKYREQIKKNLIYTVDLSECAVRQLITPEMPADEKLYYYKKAAGLYEIVLDDKYAGFYDIPLLCDWGNIAVLLMKLSREDEAEKYIELILSALEKHYSADKNDVSELLCSPDPHNTVPAEKNAAILLKKLMQETDLKKFKTQIEDLYRKYYERSAKSQDEEKV